MVEVGFTFKGRAYTAEEPCMFDLSYCTPNDFDRWAAHTGEWVAALSRKAGTPDQKNHYLRVARRYADLVQRNQGCRVSCTAATRALVSTAQLSRDLAESWGEPVEADEVRSDWGWIGSIKLPMLPGVGDLEEMIKRAVLYRYLPLLAIAVAVWLSSSKRGRRR